MLSQAKVVPGERVNPAATSQQLAQQKNQTRMLSNVDRSQPSGKLSTMKNDGLNKKFAKYTGFN